MWLNLEEEESICTLTQCAYAPYTPKKNKHLQNSLSTISFGHKWRFLTVIFSHEFNTAAFKLRHMYVYNALLIMLSVAEQNV